VEESNVSVNAEKQRQINPMRLLHLHATDHALLQQTTPSCTRPRPLDVSYLHRQSFPCQILGFLGEEEYLTCAHLLGSCCP
jgi:hypothetical protein